MSSEPIRISPVSNEIGVGDVAYRVPAGDIFGQSAGVLLDATQLPSAPSEYGFLRIAQVQNDPVPETDLVADLHSRYDIDLFDRATLATAPQRVTGFAFDDPHPDSWWNVIHQQRQMVVAVGDATALVAQDEQAEFLRLLDECWIGVVLLALRAYPDGVGTHHEVDPTSGTSTGSRS